MAVLDRNAILEAQDLPTERVRVPEWGGEVFVRALTGKEREDYEYSMVEFQGKGDKVRVAAKTDIRGIRSRLLVLTLVDADGTRLFDEEDIELLEAKSAAVLERLFNVARKLSGLSENDIEELAGDLEEGPDGISSSD